MKNFFNQYVQDHKLLVIVFTFFFLLIGSQEDLLAQEQMKFNFLNNRGEIEISYMILVSKNEHPAGSVSFKTIDNKIDLNKYKDPTIRVKIKVNKLRKNYHLNFCPTCVSDTLHGFSIKHLESDRRIIGKDGEINIEYKLNKELFNKPQLSVIKLGFILFQNGKEVEKKLYEGNNWSKTFKLILPNGIGPIAAAGQMSNLVKENLPVVGTGQSTIGPSDELATQTPSGVNKAKADEIHWEKVHARLATDATDKDKIATLIRNKPIFKTDDNRKKVQAKIDKIKGQIKNDFRVGTSSVQRGSKWEYTLEYSGTGGYIPEIEKAYIDPAITVVSEGNDRAVLEMPGDFSGEVIVKLADIVSQRIEIDMSIPQLAVMGFDALSNFIHGNIEGGKEEPFELHVIKDKRIVERIPVKGRTIKISTKDLDIPSDTYTLELYGKNTGNTVGLTKDFVYEKPWEFSDFLLPIFSLLAILFLYGLWHFRKESQRPDPAYLEKINAHNARNSTTPISAETSVGMLSKPSANTENIRTKIKISNPQQKRNQGTALTTLAPKKYPQLEEVSRVPAFLSDQMKPEKYRLIKMNKLWRESVVSDIYIHEVCAARIHNWVFKDNNDQRDIESKNIPEIGGWILGKVNHDPAANRYQVSFERFVEIYPEDQSETAISFGATAWAKLENQKEIYDHEFELVGWFHTHPGWGVFLSGDDVNLHETHFQKPFHIAMEMDSVKNNYEVGFFSRQPNKKLNNTADLIGEWFVWDSFKKDWLNES